MKSFLFLLAIAALWGCSPANPDGPTTPPSTSASDAGTSTQPVSNPADGGTSKDSPSDRTSTTATSEDQSKKNDIPNRVFQLRDLAVTTIMSKSHAIKAWVMDTPAKREEGMMWLKANDVKDDQGMLFVFPNEDPNMGFWMDNTILALDIIFIDKNRKVLNIQKGKPFDQTNLPSAGPAMFVLELKQGMAAKFEIKPGDTLKWPETIKAEN